MNIMPFVILIAMFFLGINGKNRGVVNYKFAIETIVITLVFLPKIAVFGKDRLSAFVPGTLALIISVIFGILFVFLLTNFILTKIAKIPEYEYTPADRMLGFIAGAFKGFLLMVLFVIIYGVSFADTVAPDGLTKNFKKNFANTISAGSIEYYRSSIYSVYAGTKGAGVEDLYGGKSVERKAVDMSGYVPWDAPYVPSVPKKDVPETKK